MNPRIASSFMPALRQIDPERAHGLALRALRLGLVGRGAPDDPVLASEILGIKLRNPIGVAAGFDKNGVGLACWKT